MIGYRFKRDLFNDSARSVFTDQVLTEVGKTPGFCVQLRPNQWTALLIGVVPKGAISQHTEPNPHGTRLPVAPGVVRNCRHGDAACGRFE